MLVCAILVLFFAEFGVSRRFLRSTSRKPKRDLAACISYDMLDDMEEKREAPWSVIPSNKVAI